MCGQLYVAKVTKTLPHRLSPGEGNKKSVSYYT